MIDISKIIAKIPTWVTIMIQLVLGLASSVFILWLGWMFVMEWS